MALPVGLEVGASFPPLHTDRHQPIENEEKGAWHRIEGEKCTYGKREVEFLRQRSFPEKAALARPRFHKCLQEEKNTHHNFDRKQQQHLSVLTRASVMPRLAKTFLPKRGPCRVNALCGTKVRWEAPTLWQVAWCVQGVQCASKRRTRSCGTHRNMECSRSVFVDSNLGNGICETE